MNQIPHGVVEDPRPVEEKALDHKHISGLITPLWQPKKIYKRYTQRLQDGSYSCCMQSGAKAEEVLTGKITSAIVYYLRANYPAQGMYLKNVGDIFKNNLTALEKDYPSQNQNEVTMNQKKPYSAILGISGYKQPAIKNIDQVAEAIEAYGQCLLTFESNGDEWDEPNCTPRYKGTPITFGHCLCAVDYALVNGVKTLICEDSAGQWSSADGLRLITEDFLKHRNTGALYFTGAVDKSIVDPVIHDTITTDGGKISTWGLTSFFNGIKAFLTKWGITFKETIGNMLK